MERKATDLIDGKFTKLINFLLIPTQNPQELITQQAKLRIF